MMSFRVPIVVFVAGVGLVGLAWIVDVRLAVIAAALAGTGAGAVAVRLGARRSAGQPRSADRARSADLLPRLIEMGDALHEVSADRLQQRGGWDRALFDDVLAQVEQQTPGFQAALLTYLAGPERPPAACVRALLAVDRLSAAYTYWTRLFPPRKQADSMFVLSLLHDLSEKVEHAIRVLDGADAQS